MIAHWGAIVNERLQELSPGDEVDVTSSQSVRIVESLWYEVLQATAMLLFLLSSIAVSRRQHYEGPGRTMGISLPGLPEICLTPAIFNVPDDELYGPTGVAVQMAYKGWLTEVFGLWKNRFRGEWQDSVGEGAIPPELDAFGDLRHIRNDLVHSADRASQEHSGKCATLKWFSPGDPMVFRTWHVFDFLNQTGVLSLRGASHEIGGRNRGCLFRTCFDSAKLLKWKPKPELVSVRTHDDGLQHDPPYKGVTVVFSNGLFGNVPISLTSERQWVALGKARINGTGDLEFANGAVVGAGELYKDVVAGQEPPKNGDGRPNLPVAGPWARIRR